jgi:hypothetical protein
MLHKLKPAAIGARRASALINWQVGGAEDSPARYARQAIRTELIGSDACTARGITSRSSIPVLVMCRKLIAAGHNPATPLEAYRRGILCLRIRSIGEAAALEINARGNGFIARRAVRAGPLAQKNERAGP